ncbi:P-type ATPase, HAD-like domain protein [Artemisia annua]|uniref:P-type ATPase, HAD-like domain protein n=1 Tax=Artemisia annua TaxID=35608 RepID=A0A2U1L3L4_ARTAN|nr:P-type ATPase, HAD-like domain protein [Artemisia annua]
MRAEKVEICKNKLKGSPEEVTFLIATQEFGFQFYKRTQSSMFVKEIDSSAVEVKSIIFDRLGDGGRTYQHATTMHLENYAEDGLRTMAFAYRKIKNSEYEEWISSFAKAKSIIGPQRKEKLETVSETIEKELVLLGAVAVDEKLQDRVANTHKQESKYGSSQGARRRLLPYCRQLKSPYPKNVFYDQEEHVPAPGS